MLNVYLSMYDYLCTDIISLLLSIYMSTTASSFLSLYDDDDDDDDDEASLPLVEEDVEAVAGLSPSSSLVSACVVVRKTILVRLSTYINKSRAMYCLFVCMYVCIYVCTEQESSSSQIETQTH